MNPGNATPVSCRRKGSSAKRVGRLSASVTSFFASSSRRDSGNFSEEDLLDDSEPRGGGGHASPDSPRSRQSHASMPPDPPNSPHNRRRGAHASTSGASRRAEGGDEVAQLKRSLHSLELPSALIPEVLKQKLRLDSRFFLLENSISMGTHTGNIGKLFRNRHVVRTPVSLWEEVVDCMKFQSRLATRNGISTRVWLVNEPPTGVAHKYTLGKGCSKTEAEDLIDDLKKIVPSSKECPLASRVRNLTRCLVQESERYYDEGKFVVLSICTRGLPTDKYGRSNSGSREEFRQAISSLSRSSVPVKIIIRLTTDDDDIRDYYNGWDSSIGDVDVLDDWFGESLEVYLHNPWYVTKDS